jgi:prepilin-type N-terminal cleavage/methylation domain-containing protein
MVSLKQRQSGFTIVELLIVIVIIGILATLVIVTFSGVQQKARDTERKTDINAVQKQLEAFYASKGYYPPEVDLDSASWRSSNDVKLDTKALADPSSAATTAFSVGVAGGSNTAKVYWYQAWSDAARTTACTNTAGTQCAGYTVSANLENTANGPTYDQTSQ